jgi:4-oxalomesaconate tautomerase
MSDGIPCTWMRGGTSKGAYFLKVDLPSDKAERDALLLSIMGSPDPRQIDGIGGADPLTSKVAVVSRSQRADADIDYLFLQVFVDRATVTDKQNCGNILSGVAQFAVEHGLVSAADGQTEVAVYMVNSDQVAGVTIETPESAVTYDGEARIDGVPGTAAPVLENFPEAAGSTCGALLPTGNTADVINDVTVTCIDNGMPVVVMRAADLGITGYESREELDADDVLKEKLEAIRLQAGPLMNLGDVTEKSVPKMTLVAPPRHGGVITTRTFIPHRCHASIGVLGAVEHPLGETSVVMDVSLEDGTVEVTRAAILRTARKLFSGLVYAAG